MINRIRLDWAQYANLNFRAVRAPSQRPASLLSVSTALVVLAGVFHQRLLWRRQSELHHVDSVVRGQFGPRGQWHGEFPSASRGFCAELCARFRCTITAK